MGMIPFMKPLEKSVSVFVVVMYGGCGDVFVYACCKF